MRLSLSALARTRIFLNAGGLCHLCRVKIYPEWGEPWEVEHIKPLWLGGADDESNMAPAHLHCHREKTSQEAPVKAKSDRIRARHLGIKRRKRKLGYRLFDGTPVRPT